MNRRAFLAVVGGGIVLSAAAFTSFSLTREPSRALAPWDAAGRVAGDPRRWALSHAILAPNPHNRQPWMVDLTIADEVTLLVDRSRLLPHTDPFSRQIVIGLGCFLELMTMAAAEQGYRVEIDLFPDGEDPRALTEGRVAVARFVAGSGVGTDPLFAHVLERRTLKEPYDLARPVGQEALGTLAAAGRHGTAISASRDEADVRWLRELTERALRIEVETPHTFRESVDLFRIGRAEVEANPDGIDFSGMMFESMNRLGLFTREAALDPSTTAYAQGIEAVLANARTAMAHVWQVTETNTRADQIAAGRDWVRINLAATAAGLGIQPLSQSLQEFPEMAEPYRAVHERLAPDGGTVQMLARLGYGPATARSPRWPLESRIVNS